MTHKPWILLLAGVAFLVATPASQGHKKPGQQDRSRSEGPGTTDPFTFRVPVNAVIVNVRVTDRRGQPVLDLNAEDFEVFEDGKPQEIQSFYVEPERPRSLPGIGRAAHSPTDPARFDSTTRIPVATSRLISCVFDDLATRSRQEFLAALKALSLFVSQDMRPGDLLGVFSASGRVTIPFTGERQALLQQIAKLQPGKFNQRKPYRSECPTMSDLQAERIARGESAAELQLAVEEAYECGIGLVRPGAAPAGADPQDAGLTTFRQQMAPNAEQTVRILANQQYQSNQFVIRELMDALRYHLRSLRRFQGKKSLILFSSGFVLGRDMRYALQQVIDRALRVGVAFNAIDIRGVYTLGFRAESNEGVAAVSDQLRRSALANRKFSLLSQSVGRQHEPLSQLAEETGGLLFRNNNDLYAGLRRIDQARSARYVLSYAAPSNKSQGRYHKIRVKVARRELNLSYRRGYFEPKEQLTFERSKKEDILEALRAPGNLNTLPIRLSYQSFRLGQGLYQVSFLTKISVRDVRFLREEKRHKNLVHVVLVMFDENDQYVDGRETAIQFNLSDPSYSTMRARGFTSQIDLKVPPGRYKVRTVVRESNQTKMGSVRRTILVP